MKRRRVRSSGEAGFPEGQKKLIRGAAIFLLIVCLVFSVRALLRLFYFGGTFFGITVPVQTVSKIEIMTGESVSEKLLMEYLGIREGMPVYDVSAGLFANDLGKRQKKILKAAPALSSLIIARTPANTVTVTAIERLPVARFDNSALVIDRDSVVFVRYSGTEMLPVIKGYKGAAPLEPGQKITSHKMMDSAIELIQCLDAGACNVRKGYLQSIDVSKQDSILCNFTDQRQTKLAWKEMGRGTEMGFNCLVAQLNGVIEAIQSPRGCNFQYFDATIPGHAYGSNLRR